MLIQTPNDSSQTYGDGADFPRDRRASVNAKRRFLAFGELAIDVQIMFWTLCSGRSCHHGFDIQAHEILDLLRVLSKVS